MPNIIGKDMEKLSFHILLIRVYVDRTTLEKYLAISAVFTGKHILWSNNITLEYISNRKACMGSLKDIGKKVHRSIIHNIPNLETTKYHSPMKRINESPVIQWHTIQLRKRDCDCTKTPLINLTNTLRKRSQIWKNTYYVIIFVKYSKTGKWSFVGSQESHYLLGKGT